MAKQQQDGRLLVHLLSCKFDVVRQATSQLGYEEVGDDEEDWHLMWSDLSVSTERVSKLRQFQRLNHFPSMLEICRKGPLSRHMARMALRLPDEYSFYPLSFNLPDQLDELLVQLRRNEYKMLQGSEGVHTFILKPTNGSQGHGIHLVQTCGQLQELGREVDMANLVAQMYIGSPLLLDGFKFDLRIYALVLSVDPLDIYLYDEGLARLATVPYQAPTSDNLNTITMHLTNYSVNKKSNTFVSSDGSGSAVGQATKRPASAVLQKIALQRGCSYSHLVQGISDIIVRTVMAVQPMLSHKYHTAISCSNRDVPTRCAACPCLALDHWSDEGSQCSCPPSQCFELLGFDIMFDSDLNPWLLEVNHSPSLACDALIDLQVKSALLTDTLCALGQRPEDRQSYFEEQHRAMTERLYSQSTTGTRRPLTSIPKSKQLQAACAALEELEALIPSHCTPSRTIRGFSARPSSSHASPHSPADLPTLSSSPSGPPRGPSLSRPSSAHSPPLGLGRSGGMSALGPGLLPDQQFLPGSKGRFTRIYPPAVQPEEHRARLMRIMTAASNAFPDQRCSCAWCTRRARARQCASASRDLHAAASSACISRGGDGGGARARHRPASANLPINNYHAGGGGGVKGEKGARVHQPTDPDVTVVIRSGSDGQSGTGGVANGYGDGGERGTPDVPNTPGLSGKPPPAPTRLQHPPSPSACRASTSSQGDTYISKLQGPPPSPSPFLQLPASGMPLCPTTSAGASPDWGGGHGGEAAKSHDMTQNGSGKAAPTSSAHVTHVSKGVRMLVGGPDEGRREQGVNPRVASSGSEAGDNGRVERSSSQRSPARIQSSRAGPQPGGPSPASPASACRPPRPSSCHYQGGSRSDRHLDKYLKVLYPSLHTGPGCMHAAGTRGRTLSAPLESQHGALQGEVGDETSHKADGSSRARHTPAGSGKSAAPDPCAGSGGEQAGSVRGSPGGGEGSSSPGPPRRSVSNPLVPRVALLSSPSARRNRGRSLSMQHSSDTPGGDDAPMDPTLMLLRMRTAVVLSNSFVTCYMSDLPGGSGRGRSDKGAIGEQGESSKVRAGSRPGSAWPSDARRVSDVHSTIKK